MREFHAGFCGGKKIGEPTVNSTHTDTLVGGERCHHCAILAPPESLWAHDNLPKYELTLPPHTLFGL